MNHGEDDSVIILQFIKLVGEANKRWKFYK